MAPKLRRAALTSEQLNALAVRAVGGDRQAENSLVMALSWAIQRRARKISRGVAGSADYAQEGLLGALNAIRRFEPQRGVPIEAWALDKANKYMLTHHRMRLRFGKEASNGKFDFDEDAIVVIDDHPYNDQEQVALWKSIRTHAMLATQRMPKLEKETARAYILSDDHTLKQIAEAHHVEVSFVVRSVKKALKRISNRVNRNAI